MLLNDRVAKLASSKSGVESYDRIMVLPVSDLVTVPGYVTLRSVKVGNCGGYCADGCTSVFPSQRIHLEKKPKTAKVYDGQKHTNTQKSGRIGLCEESEGTTTNSQSNRCRSIDKKNGIRPPQSEISAEPSEKWGICYRWVLDSAQMTLGYPTLSLRCSLAGL